MGYNICVNKPYVDVGKVLHVDIGSGSEELSGMSRGSKESSYNSGRTRDPRSKSHVFSSNPTLDAPSISQTGNSEPPVLPTEAVHLSSRLTGIEAPSTTT